MISFVWVSGLLFYLLPIHFCDIDLVLSFGIIQVESHLRRRLLLNDLEVSPVSQYTSTYFAVKIFNIKV